MVLREDGKIEIGVSQCQQFFQGAGREGEWRRGANWNGKWGQERVFMVACLYVNAGGKEKTGDAREKRGNW